VSVKLLHGDCREMLRSLDAASVQTCVTSPPYFGLRDYGVSGQIGLEPTLAEYIAAMVDVFREVRRVLRDDGTVFLNVGDSYHTDSPVRTKSAEAFSETWDKSQTASRGGLRKSAAKSGSLKNKDLMLVPARLAIALQEDGWYVRSDIIWHKPNPMPESVRDRPTNAYEHIFLLTKSPRYYYDADAIREPNQTALPVVAKPRSQKRHPIAHSTAPALEDRKTDGWGSLGYNALGRNARNVWTITTRGFSGAHFAVFPPELPRRCILAGTSERGGCPACGAPWRRVVERSGASNAENERLADYDVPGLEKRTSHDRVRRLDGKNYTHVLQATNNWEPSCACSAGEPVPQIVLDPFAGAGTTLMVADQLGRNGIGIELNADYLDLARKRLYADAPLLQGAAD
jgi:DNA modification methylase